MSYTVDELFTRACSLVDSLKNDGTVDTSTTADYKARTLTLVDLAQKELLRQGDNYKSYEMSRKPITNLYGYTSGFGIQEYDGVTALTLEANGSAKAYYFETDSNGGTAYVEDFTGAWNTLLTVNLVNTGDGFVAYRGAVTPTAGATKTRIRFVGSYYYKVVNYALFAQAFESGKEPIYRPWVPITLPTDVKLIDKVIAEYPERQYNIDGFYKIERNGSIQTLYLNYYFEGKIRVQYKPVTTKPTAMTDTVSIDDVTATAICYYLAMNFVATEQNEYLSGLFRSLYDRAKAEAMIKQPMETSDIIDYYGGA